MTELITTVFDVETNGKRPKYRKGDTNQPPQREPAVVQIAAKQFWGRRVVGQLSFFMQPLDADGNAAAIPTEKFFIESGITQDVVDAAGTTYRVGMAAFHNLLKKSDRLVAHNMEFDGPVTRASLIRAWVPTDEIDRVDRFCTMQSLTDVLKIPGKYGFKFPSLDEAYRALVDPEGFDGAHDAMVDVDACAAILWATEDAGHPLKQF